MAYPEPHSSFILEPEFWKETGSFSTEGHISVSDKTGIDFKNILTPFFKVIKKINLSLSM